MTDLTAEIPPELFARLAHPTVRLSGSIDEGGRGVVPQSSPAGVGGPGFDRRGAI
jgi:hypothetical protein